MDQLIDFGDIFSACMQAMFYSLATKIILISCRQTLYTLRCFLLIVYHIRYTLLWALPLLCEISEVQLNSLYVYTFVLIMLSLYLLYLFVIFLSLVLRMLGLKKRR